MLYSLVDVTYMDIISHLLWSISELRAIYGSKLTQMIRQYFKLGWRRVGKDQLLSRVGILLART